MWKRRKDDAALARARDELLQLMRAGTPEEFLAAAEAACARYPNAPDLEVRRAVGLEGTGRAEEAVDVARHAAHRPEADSSARIHAAALLFRAGRDQDVVAVLSRIKRHELAVPLRAEMDYMRGVLAAARGEVDEANVRLQSAIDCDPREWRYFAAMAELRMALGDRAGAAALGAAAATVSDPEALREHLAALGVGP